MQNTRFVILNKLPEIRYIDLAKAKSGAPDYACV